MAPADGDFERRKEQVEEAVDKAKEGAKKLFGWLGRKVDEVADKARANPALREQVEKLEQFKAERAQGRLQAGVREVYDDYLGGLQRVIEELRADHDARAASVEEINVSIQQLRLRGKDESDRELAEYALLVKTMRVEMRELERSEAPFREEMERMNRALRVALARLQADPGLSAQLQTEAEQDVAESKARLEALTRETEA